MTGVEARSTRPDPQSSSSEPKFNSGDAMLRR
jgi:hypothetical protein